MLEGDITTLALHLLHKALHITEKRYIEPSHGKAIRYFDFDPCVVEGSGVVVTDTSRVFASACSVYVHT